ncbi:MAG TPA: S-methyl-5-thioribose-1-phosphate isomerase [Candidatus Atribacteria bacterium]|nr:MAG: Methylthioribose-1-phosphate isomerase [Atribacteria bacterium 34_128]HAJ32956.1 S-methyl-5-thioribose-1-phosphate isomerase [Candidatus Atribacteria bacterium]
MKTIEWKDGKVFLIDQRKLPQKYEIINCSTYQEVAEAIKKMKIRGAPAIGVAAAFGMALAAYSSKAENYEIFIQDMEKAKKCLVLTRPTAVNLFWALERMMNLINIKKDVDLVRLKDIILQEAENIAGEDIEINKTMGRYGASLIKNGDNILTHCNAGALATVDHGTALGVIRTAFKEGKKIHVYVDETRPVLQGTRLTAWELMQEKIPFTLIADNMAGFLMSQKKINLIIVGADRIARNGDVVNKIGTYSLSVLARENKVPFYVAAPISTIDMSLKSGGEIPIEERDPKEVTHILGKQMAPAGVKVFNPAFDLTPNGYVEAIITEKGIIRKPFEENIKLVC